MSLPKIGAVLALDGEREYRSAISSVNVEQRALRAEMKLVTEEFYGQENSIEALTEKHRVLEQQHEAQTAKINVCEQAVRKYAQAQEEAGKKVDEASRNLQKAEEGLEELKNTSGAAAEELKKQEEAVRKAREGLESANKEYENASRKGAEWRTSLANATAELIKTGRALEDTEGYMEEARRSVDHCAESIDEFGNEAKSSGNESEEFQKKTSDAFGALAAVMSTGTILEGVKGIAEGLKNCVDKSASFETAVAKIATIADTTEVPLSGISSEILELSSNMGVAADDIAEAAYEAISSGQSTANAVNFAGEATMLAVGGFTQAATAVDILTTTLNAYGLQAEETGSISDMLITTQNLGKTTVDELAAAMGRVIPLASAYNVQMDNLSSAYAIMTANGIATAETTTYLASMLGELGDSGSEVSGILQQQTGKSFAQLSKEGYSLGDVLEILGKSVQNDTVKFSSLWSSSEAGVGALSLLNSGAEKYNSTLDAMRNSTGATEEAFNTMADTSEMAQARMETSAENLQIAIGDVLRPAIDEAYESGADLLSWATDFVEEHPEVVQALTALTAGVGTFAASLTVATAAMKAFELIKTLVNPASLLVTALIGLAGAAAAYAATCETVDTAQQKVVLETQEAVKSARELAKAHEEAAGKREADRKDMELQAAACSSLAEELIALNEKTSLTADEQTRMQMAVEQLSQTYPDLNLAIDEQTGKLNMSSEALMENVEAMNQLAIAQAAQEDLTEIAAEQYEEYKKLLELQEQLEEQEQAVTAATLEYEEALQRTAETGEALWSQNADMELQRQQEAYGALEEQVNATQAAYDALGEQWAETNEFISDTSAQLTAQEAVGNTQAAYGEAAEGIAGTAGEIQQAFSSMGESIRASVEEQMDIFGKYEEQNAVSSEQLIQNMNDQVAAVQNWGDNLSSLAERSDENGMMISQGLLNHLVELGPEGAGYVQAFVEMTDEQLKEANELWAQSIALPETIAEQFEATGESLAAGLTSGIENSTSKVEKAMQNTGSKSLTALNKTVEVNSPSKKTEQTGKELMNGLVFGVNTGKPLVLNAMTLAATETVNTARQGLASSIFDGIGRQVPAGLASGIRAGKSQVINAAVEVATAAIQAAKATLQINSPSKVTEEMGGYYMDGWIGGIRARTENLKDAVSGALSEALIEGVDMPGYARESLPSSGNPEGGAPAVQIYFQPQQMTEEELDRAFDYVNARFGYAL